MKSTQKVDLSKMQIFFFFYFNLQVYTNVFILESIKENITENSELEGTDNDGLISKSAR